MDFAKAFRLWIKLHEFIGCRVKVLLQRGSAPAGDRVADAQLHHGLHVRNANEDSVTICADISAARRQPVDAGGAVGLVLGGTIGVGALVTPGGERVVGGISGLSRIERHVEAEQHALVHRHDFTRQQAVSTRVAHAAESGERVEGIAPADDLETCEVKLAVRRIYRAVQRGEIKRARDAHHAGLRPGAAIIHEHAQQLRFVEANLHHRVVERPHLRIEKPHL